jgi:hypothetical protein
LTGATRTTAGGRAISRHGSEGKRADCILNSKFQLQCCSMSLPMPLLILTPVRIHQISPDYLDKSTFANNYTTVKTKIV